MASSSLDPHWRYDVFLNFGGEDTRKGFTDHLYNALVRQGIDTFTYNEELERGTSISAKLNEAIEQSRVAVVILSKSYASSRWCLDELVKIVECMGVTGQTVLPVFYDVNPSDVRKQSGSFAKAFEAHERHFGDSLDKVQRWRDTLTQVANLSGFHLQDRHETEFIQKIVQEVVNGRTPPSFPEDLVGIGPRIKELMTLCSEIKTKNDVGFIGIWGMGGIGKTTLAQCFRNKMYNQFDCVSFLENIRESSAKGGEVGDLQEKLLSDLHIKFLKRGFAGSEIKPRLANKKVLIILDDVNTLKQLEALAGSADWFGQGSIIIITTRDKHLLNAHGVHKIYEARKLNGEEALTLFSWKAFKNGCEEDTEKYMELSQSFLKYAKGLPLAIAVLGKSLCGRSLTEWESTFARNQGNLNDEIMSVLQLGFDGLRDEEKEIFLDIACFFKGKDRVDASMVLDSFGFFPGIAISRLIENSLISIVEGRLWMHDLVQEMGWKIVRQKFPKEPGRWSRLWRWEDVLQVLNHNEGTDAVEGIVLNLPHEEMVSLSCDAFSKMKKLRFLKISGAVLPRGLKYLSTELGFMEWHGYSSKLLPPNFPAGKLVQLNMYSSQIKLLWKGFKALEKLKSIELIDSESLTETPDFTGVSNLERLILRDCTRLHKIHPSIATLKRLVLLNMENCKSLENLPGKISLGSLETFVLSGCTRLKNFPEIVGLMESLSKLYLDRTAIKELPSSIAHLSGLSLLDLKDCRYLLRLPSAISSLTALKHMILSGCTSLEEVPEQIGDVESLEELDISGSAVREIPSSIVRLQNLKLLSCSGCKGRPSTLRMRGQFTAVCPGMALLLPSSFIGLHSVTSLNLSDCNLLDGALPDDLDSLSSLRDLNLIGNNFTSIPESICRLPKLKELLIRNCTKLQSLPKLPASIQRVSADGCISLKSDSDQYEVWNSWHSDKEQYLYIIKRSRSHTYGVVMTALRFIAWLHRDQNHQVQMSEPLRPSHGFSSGAHILPDWFSARSRSSSIPIVLDRESLQPWRGFALYVCCEVDDNFDTRCDFKIMHTFDCYFHTNQGQYPKQIQTLYQEINVKGVPFTGPNGYWLYAPQVWFSQRVTALKECTSIEAHTTIDCPGIEVKMSGAQLLYGDQDFVAFIQSITANSWVPLKSRSPGSSRSTMTLKRRFESIPVQSYQSRKTVGGKKYVIEGNIDNPHIASAFGEILQDYSSGNVFYTSSFPECKCPKWFFRDISGSDLRKNWKGIVVCVAFTVHGPRTVELANLDMKYIIQTTTGLSEDKIHLVTKSTMSELKQLKQRDCFWISYTSRGSLADNVGNKCISLEVVTNWVIS